MRGAVLCLPLLLGVVSGCATSDLRPSEISYVPPAESPATARRGPRTAVRLAHLATAVGPPATVAPQGRARGRAGRADGDAYQGDPEPYVDCGWIIAHGPQGPTKTPGSIHEATFDRASDGHVSILKHSLKLDGRMVIQVRPAEFDTLVSVDSTYVLTKVIAIEEPSRPTRESNPEFVSFTTGKRGQITKGTVCQPTGQLERVVLDVLSAEVM